MGVIEILGGIAAFILYVCLNVILIVYIYNRIIKGKPSKSQVTQDEINAKLGKICNYIDKLEEDSNANCNTNISDN